LLILSGILLVAALNYQELVDLSNLVVGWWEGLTPSRQGFVSLLVSAIAGVAGYLALIKPRSASARRLAAAHRSSSFPFGVYNTRNLDDLSRALECRHFDLPRSARLPQTEQIKLEDRLEDRFLLLTGRRGLGKTRECIELFRRIAKKKGEDITILHPRGDFDRPKNDTVPEEFAPRTLILFIDEIETRCWAEDARIARDGQPVRTFHDRLAATIDWISSRQGSRDWKIVLTASDEAEDLKKIDLDAGIFGKFTQIQLPAIYPTLRKGFVADVARHFSISIDNDVLSYIAAVSDGTPRGIVIPFAKRSSELDDRPGEMDLAYAKEFRFSYPSDWITEVFEPLIRGHPERKAIFDAFAILRYYRLEYDKKIVISLSARILNKYPLQYINNSIIAKTIKRDLRAWIFDTPGENFLCPAAYIGHFVDLAGTLPLFLKSVEAAARAGLPFEVIRPAIPSIERAAAKSGEAQSRVIGFFRTLSKQYPTVPQIWNSLSKLCSIGGKFEEAYSAATTAVAIDGGDVQSLVGLAAVEERRGHIQSAIEAARTATRVGSESDFAWLNLGVLLGKRGFHRDAIKALQRACEINPEGARSWFSLGIAYERAGLMEEAKDSCRRATQIEPSNFAAWHTLGIVYDKMGAFPESIEALQEALKLARSEPSPWLSLAWSLIRSGDRAGAIEVLQEVQSLHGDDADLLAKVSISFVKAGDIVRSNLAAGLALQIDRHNAVAKRCIAYNLLHSSATVDQGLEKLREIAESSSSADDFSALSSAYRRVDRIDEAVEAGRRALAIAPSNERAKRNLAINLGLQQSDSGESVRLWEELARDAGTVDNWITLSVVYSKIGRIDEAIGAARQAFQIDPESESAKRSLAINLGALNPGSEENITLREELARSSGASADWVTLSVTYSNADRIEDAIQAARQALKIDPDNAKAKRSLAINLGLQRAGSEESIRLRDELARGSGAAADWVTLSVTYSKADRIEDAIQAARQALQIEPDSENAKRSLAINLGILNPVSEENIRLREELARGSGAAGDWVSLSIALSKAERHDEAIEAARQALRIAPDNVRAKRTLAIILEFRRTGADASGGLGEELRHLADPSVGWGSRIRSRPEPQVGDELAREIGIAWSNDPENRADEALRLREELADSSDRVDDWTALSIAYNRAGRCHDAVRAARRAVEIDPTNKNATKSLAINLAMTDPGSAETKGLIEELDAAAATPEELVAVSIAYSKAGMFDLAARTARRALELNASDYHAKRSLAINLANLNPGSSEAIELRQQVADVSNLPEDWYGLGCLLGNARRFEESAVALERALSISPTYEEAESALARNLANLPERVAEAIEIREKLCALHGTAGDWAELSWAYGKGRRHDEAINAALKALALNPNQNDALQSLALNIPRAGELDKDALDQVELSFVNEGTSDNWLQLARYYGLSKQYLKAVEAADQALAREAKSSPAWHLKAMNLDALGRTDEADTAWEKYARLSPSAPAEPISDTIRKLESNFEDRSAWRTLFTQCIDNNHIDIAKIYIRKFGNFAEAFDSIVYTLADIMSFDFDAISSMLECVLEFQENNSLANHLVGTAKRKFGRPSEAIAFLKKACTLAPDMPNYFYAVGRAFEDLNDREQAREYFAQALAIDPSYKKASNALDRLGNT
jgi:tetratricopeptide (TPR) repeat protein